MQTQTDPDASGGLGSFKTSALGFLTGIVQTVGIPYLAKELNLTETMDASGTVRYAGAPSGNNGLERTKDVLTHPLFMVGALALFGFIIWRQTK